MQAVVKIQGRQYKVEEGRYLLVDRFAPDNDTVELTEVLYVSGDDKTLLGTPTVQGAKIKARVLSHLRDKKVLVYKMRPKKGYRLKRGHRQELTRLQIEFIEFPGRTSPQVKPVEKPARPEKAAAPKKSEAKASAKASPQASTVTQTEAPSTEKTTAKKAGAPKAKKSEAGGEKKASSSGAKKPAAKKPAKDKE